MITDMMEEMGKGIKLNKIRLKKRRKRKNF
jgi:hypothetical protein